MPIRLSAPDVSGTARSHDSGESTRIGAVAMLCAVGGLPFSSGLLGRGPRSAGAAPLGLVLLPRFAEQYLKKQGEPVLRQRVGNSLVAVGSVDYAE